MKGRHGLHRGERIEEIAKKFGGRIKKIKLFCSIQSETPTITDLDLIAILKFLPNLEELTLFNIYIHSEITDIHPPNELDLLQLKTLDLNYCVLDNNLLLDLIPANILTDLVFTFDSPDETIYQKFFNRQANIKRLEIFENELLNFEHLDLNHLKISSGIDFVVTLNQQKKLKYLDFAISWIDENVFDTVLKLSDLETLRTLIDLVPSRVFKRLTELKHLKELRIESHSSFDCGHLLTLSMMTGMQLERLTLYYGKIEIPKEILIQISKNFAQLKHIQIVNRSIQNLVTVAENFPNMESILMDFFAIFYAPGILEVSDGLRHEHLKQLVITNLNSSDMRSTQPLLKFCNSCPNLERIMLSTLTDIRLSDIEEIFAAHPKLTHLSLGVNDFKFDFVQIVIVSRLISNLQYFRMGKLISYPSYTGLQCLFREFFPKIKLHKYDSGDAEIIMKRRSSEDWYSSFNIRDHF